MARPFPLEAHDEYVFFIEALRVMDEADARARSPRHPDEAEAIAEQIGEIAAERALDGSPTSSSDARRIWTFQNRCRALRQLADFCPLHAEAARCLINSIYL